MSIPVDAAPFGVTGTGAAGALLSATSTSNTVALTSAIGSGGASSVVALVGAAVILTGVSALGTAADVVLIGKATATPAGAAGSGLAKPVLPLTGIRVTVSAVLGTGSAGTMAPSGKARADVTGAAGSGATATPAVSTSGATVWSSNVPDVNYIIGAHTTYDLAQHTSGSGNVFSLGVGTPPNGITLFSSGALTDVSASVADWATIQVNADQPAPTATVTFAELPEFVFIETLPKTEQLGPFQINPANRWTPGDLFRVSGWTAGSSPCALVNDVSGTPLSDPYLSWNAATGELTHLGGGTGVAVRDYALRLVCGSVSSAAFRVRILRPNYIYGVNAATKYPTWTAQRQDESKTLQQFRQSQNNAMSAARDATPAVLLVLGGDYTLGSFTTENGKYAFYLLGETTNRPILRNGSVTQKFATVPSFRIVFYVKGFELINVGLSYSTTASNQTTDMESVYECDMYMHDQVGLGFDAHSASNQEFDGTGSASFPIIQGQKRMHFWNSQYMNVGGDSLHHVFYLHGRPGGSAYFNNLKIYGGRDCQQIKSTLPILRVRNCDLSALFDPLNPGAVVPGTSTPYDRANNCIDQINVSDTVVYNCRMRGAFNTSYPSRANGVQSGLIFFRARRECFGSDAPAYPQPWGGAQANPTPQTLLDDAYNTGTTVIYGGGYFAANDPRFPWLQGFDCTTATFKSAAFWSAVAARAITDPLNGYAFRHDISYCSFEWVQQVGATGVQSMAIRNDGTYPRYVYSQGDAGSIYVRVPSQWRERSVDNLLNNTFSGWTTHTQAQLFEYASSESIESRVTPNPMPGALWPRTQPYHFPVYSLVGGNGLGAPVAPVAVPSWFRL